MDYPQIIVVPTAILSGQLPSPLAVYISTPTKGLAEPGSKLAAATDPILDKIGQELMQCISENAERFKPYRKQWFQGGV